ncbi:MAG: magnesium transporter, partial [Gemmatimonadales bacterium]
VWKRLWEKALALAEMEETEHPEDVLAQLGPGEAADIVEELDDDDAADLIGDLPPDRAAQILAEVEDRAGVERLLRYDEESAGGLMTGAVVALPQSLTAGEALEDIRRQAREIEEFYQVFCVDEHNRLVGVLPLQRLVVAPPDTIVRQIMEDPPATVGANVDQEEVARLMARYNVPSLPVVGSDDTLLGRVTFDDVIDVVEAETTEDILKFGGAPADEELTGTWHQAARRRLPWLYVNLLTAFLAAAVVFFFQNTIDRVIALAVWMPVIAGMGGNAGTQALAVTVRRIALELVPAREGLVMVGKELLVGVVNGLAVGMAVAVVAAVLDQGWKLGLVVLLAMWGNLVVATAAGAAIPLVLKRLGADPAIASSVFVTALTDVCGFLLLLGLGAALIL